ncbi:MAG: sugar kinase [Gemmatimonadetes bacterium RIFCSPLOWO2_12_FULL_68_9]|nr:MAG: sugar kinase [Gemmatimonadetes bacterium RIFCSPLOWO2_12_FULL_68_9]
MPRSILGVDVGGTNARAALVRNQRLGEVSSVRIHPQGSAEEVLDQLCGLIDRTKPGDVDGVGIGVPSVVDIVKGIVYDVQNIPSWREVPLKAILEDRYAVPVLVNNDANCFALGEKHFGKGIGCRSLIGLILGTGFAGGIIIDGRLYPGRNCGAGEFGLIPYLESIYEHYCSGQFFTRHAGQTGAELFRRATEGDREAMKVFAEFGHHLGQAVKTILYAYDPETIVLGGSVRKAFRFFEDAMWESIRSFAFSNSIKSLTIAVSELEHVAILGAAALHYDAELAAT